MINGFAMYEIVIVLLLLVSIAIVALILVQQGKGAGMGASFGAGAANTVFGSAGSGNFLTRSTWILALVFFGLCLFIGWLQKQNTNEAGDFTNIEAAATETVEQSPEDVPSLGDVPTLGTSDSDVPAVDGAEQAGADADGAAVADDAAAAEGEAADQGDKAADKAAAEGDKKDAATSEEVKDAAEAATEEAAETDAEVKEAVESSNNK